MRVQSATDARRADTVTCAYARAPRRNKHGVTSELPYKHAVFVIFANIGAYYKKSFFFIIKVILMVFHKNMKVLLIRENGTIHYLFIYVHTEHIQENTQIKEHKGTNYFKIHYFKLSRPPDR